MTKEVCSNIGLWLLFTLLIGNYVVNLEGSHHVYKRLSQSTNTKSPSVNQPYRTGFHFQPPKNWMNGMFKMPYQSQSQCQNIVSLLSNLCFVLFCFSFWFVFGQNGLIIGHEQILMVSFFFSYFSYLILFLLLVNSSSYPIDRSFPLETRIFIVF